MTDMPTPPSSAPLRLAPALRRARENREISLLQAAADLKLPMHVLEHLEQGQFDQLGAAVFARGYMRSYARYLGVDESLCSDEDSMLVGTPPPLASRQHTPRMRVWVDRYAVKAVYVVLTLAIVVPALFVAKQFAPDSLLRPQHSLDEPVTSEVDLSAHRAPVGVLSGDGDERERQNGVRAQPADQGSVEAVRASMTPLFGGATKSAEVEQSPAVAPMAEPGPVGWEFVFVGDSWVEIVDASGLRLEFGLVRSGTRLRYANDQLSSIAIGNAEVVRVSRGGEAVDMAPFRRANVARFKVSSGGELAPAGG